MRPRRTAALLLLMLMIVLGAASSRGAHAQTASSGPVFALPGHIEAADAPLAGVLVESDGTRTALVGATPALARDLRDLAKSSARVAVWGLRQPPQADNLPLLRVSRVVELPAAPPSPVLPTPSPSPTAPRAGGTPTSYPTLVSLPAIGQPIADITVYAANVRAGPGNEFAPIASVQQGARCLILGRALVPGWHYLQCPGATGWVLNGLYSVQGDVAALPALVPASPTPDPAATPLPPRWHIAAFTNRGLAGEPALNFGADDVNFAWGQTAPAEGLPVDDFALRLEGLLPFASGVYSIELTYDDGARLFVNHELVIDDWNEGAVRMQSWAGALAGDVPLRIEYFEAYGDATLQMVITPLQTQADPPTPVPAPARPQLPPADAGWLATYYVGATPGGSPALAQVEALDREWPVDRAFDAAQFAPGAANSGPWSARWRGRFTFDGGDYRFVARGKEGVRVYIDGVRIIDAWPNGADEVSTIVREIAPGTHEVAVEMYAEGETTWVRAGWVRLDAGA